MKLETQLQDRLEIHRQDTPNAEIPDEDLARSLASQIVMSAIAAAAGAASPSAPAAEAGADFLYAVLPVLAVEGAEGRASADAGGGG